MRTGSSPMVCADAALANTTQAPAVANRTDLKLLNRPGRTPRIGRKHPPLTAATRPTTFLIRLAVLGIAEQGEARQERQDWRGPGGRERRDGVGLAERAAELVEEEEAEAKRDHGPGEGGEAAQPHQPRRKRPRQDGHR